MAKPKPDPTVCPRCGADRVPRCGCGSRLEISYPGGPSFPVPACAVIAEHGQRGVPLASCLCGRLNVGPDRVTPQLPVSTVKASTVKGTRVRGA